MSVKKGAACQDHPVVTLYVYDDAKWEGGYEAGSRGPSRIKDLFLKKINALYSFPSIIFM